MELLAGACARAGAETVAMSRKGGAADLSETAGERDNPWVRRALNGVVSPPA